MVYRIPTEVLASILFMNNESGVSLFRDRELEIDFKSSSHLRFRDLFNQLLLKVQYGYSC